MPGNILSSMYYFFLLPTLLGRCYYSLHFQNGEKETPGTDAFILRI